jgi:hypothetical protein
VGDNDGYAIGVVIGERQLLTACAIAAQLTTKPNSVRFAATSGVPGVGLYGPNQTTAELIPA